MTDCFLLTSVYLPVSTVPVFPRDRTRRSPLTRKLPTFDLTSSSSPSHSFFENTLKVACELSAILQVFALEFVQLERIRQEKLASLIELKLLIIIRISWVCITSRVPSTDSRLGKIGTWRLPAPLEHAQYPRRFFRRECVTGVSPRNFKTMCIRF